jgi:Na+-driven multidrug efflux pump
MKITLSEHFTSNTLVRFTFPPVVMMLFTSIYGVVDGLFVSNVAGETAFASINLIMPFSMIFGAVGALLGVGGSALISMVRGQGEEKRANRIFSMLIGSMLVLGMVFMAVGEILLPAAARFFGATESMMPLCISYARILLLALPAFILEYGFQSFMIAAERPNLGLGFTVAAGVTNMILDWLFIAVLKKGVVGAAVATCIGQCVGGFGPLIFFLRSRSSPLQIVRSRFMPREFFKAASNGLAEFITNIAMSVVAIVFNLQLMKYIGEYGVAAYGIIMYVNFVFVAVYLGYAMGVAPVISYHYGTGLRKELQGLFRKSLVMVATASVVLSSFAIIGAGAIASIFAGYDPEFLTLSTRALRLYALSYFFAGFNIFGCNFFAALNNGLISGILSALRLFVFQLTAVLILPLILGNDGIWLSMLTSDLCVFGIMIVVLRKERPRFGY